MPRSGELLRLWAAGHLEKSHEVTASGPYRYMRHPLYLGSSLIGIGAGDCRHQPASSQRSSDYLGLTLTAACRSEEAHLREKFGDAYDAYGEKRMAPMTRDLQLSARCENREHHTIAGLFAGFALLAAKILF